jgi:hypothetical protein
LFDSETNYGTGQNKQQGTGQKQEFLFLTKPHDNIIILFFNTKIPILFFNINNIISLSLTDAILFCPVLPCSVMFCPVLFCPVLTVLQIKRTLRV